MSDETKIAWADATWCWVRGCTPHSSGCRECYARRMAARFSDGPANGKRALWGHTFATRTKDNRGKWTGKVALIPEKLELPLRWKKPRRIFVNSTSDTFHPLVSFDDITRGFSVMAQCSQHAFLALTKRAGRMREWFEWMRKMNNEGQYVGAGLVGAEWPLPNVWLGVTTENQNRADERVPELLRCPAAVRFLSIEPMLGPVDLHQLHCSFVGWVICGCESGPNARLMDLDWVRSIRDQCVEAGVPFFFKQAMIDGQLVETPELDGRVWEQFPG